VEHVATLQQYRRAAEDQDTQLGAWRHPTEVVFLGLIVVIKRSLQRSKHFACRQVVAFEKKKLKTVRNETSYD